MVQIFKTEDFPLNLPTLKPNLFSQTATMGALCFGTALGYSSPAGILLTSNSTDSSLQLTTVENSWFSSSVNLGALVGGPIGGLCINAIGRRGTLLAVFPFFFGSWTIIGEGGLVCLSYFFLLGVCVCFIVFILCVVSGGAYLCPNYVFIRCICSFFLLLLVRFSFFSVLVDRW